MSLNTLLLCVVYLLLAPAVGGLLAGGEQILRCRVQKRKKGPDFLQPFRDLIGLLKLKPICEGTVYLRCAAVYLICMLLTGCFVVAGGSLWLAALVGAAGYTALAIGYRFAGQGGEDDFLRAIAVFLLYSFTAFGFFLVAGFASGHGSFQIADMVAAGQAPVKYLPGVTLALILYGIGGWQDSYITQKMIGEYTGKVLALLEAGRWLERPAYFAVLFLCHFAGDVATAVAGVLVCLVVFVLRVALTPLRLRWQERASAYGLATLCLLLCSGNFLILLAR